MWVCKDDQRESAWKWLGLKKGRHVLLQRSHVYNKQEITNKITRRTSHATKRKAATCKHLGAGLWCGPLPKQLRGPDLRGGHVGVHVLLQSWGLVRQSSAATHLGFSVGETPVYPWYTVHCAKKESHGVGGKQLAFCPLALPTLTCRYKCKLENG